MNNSEHILSSPQKFFIRKNGYEIQMLCHFSSDSNIFIRFVEGNHLVYLLPAGAPFEAWHTGKVIHEGWDDFAPFMTEEFLKDHPERDAILNGEKRFDAESARAIYPEMKFLPNTQWGYAPCLCGRKCDVACYRHLVGEL